MKKEISISENFKKFVFIIPCVLLLTNSYSQKYSDTSTIIAVGDIMPGTNFPNSTYLPPDSGKNLFTPVKNILMDADITLGNLEGCLLNSGGSVKKCQDSTKCYAFRIPTFFSGIIKEAGFDVLNLANNHSGDFGEIGKISTMKTLDSVGILYAGLELCPHVIFIKNNIRFGFCGFSPFKGTMDMTASYSAKKTVHLLDSLCDIVIVSVHAGAEGAKNNHVIRQPEIFCEEVRGNIYEFSHSMIDAGADIIIGHGPHVTRAIELYKNRIIFYSLGNFCTYARFNLKEANGVAPIVQIFTTNKGEFIAARAFSIIQKEEGGPLIDDSKSAIKQILELTKTDFPENLLEIELNGNIFKK